MGCYSSQTPEKYFISPGFRSGLTWVPKAWWPVNPILLILIIPLLPSWLYLNRGYTIWFHNISLAYLLTMNESLRRFLIVQGTGISLGWWAALVYDFYVHGRYAHILYMNMPGIIKQAMVNEAGHVFYTSYFMLY